MGRGGVDLPRRLYPKFFFALLGFVACVSVAIVVAGLADARALVYLSVAAACITAGSLAWEVVERSAQKSAESPGLAAWLAFPLAGLLAMASFPFLALAIYPEAERYFTEAGRLDAVIVGGGDRRRLVIRFPRATREQGTNLRLNDRPLTSEYLATRPDLLEWRGAHQLSIPLAQVLEDLGIERLKTIGINLLPSERPFLYEDGERVPQQSAQVREE